MGVDLKAILEKAKQNKKPTKAQFQEMLEEMLEVPPENDPVWDIKMSPKPRSLPKADSKLTEDITTLKRQIADLEDRILSPKPSIEIDWDGFSKWIQTLNPADHNQKSVINLIKNRKMYFLIDQIKGLLEKYQKIKH